MKPINAIIVDDELRARRVLTNLVKDNCADITIVGEADSVDEAVELINQTQVHLVFLDIEMPNAMGYNLFSRFDEVFFDVIFVTAYNQYAIKAFELNAIDYLVKPINRKRLIQAVEKSVLRAEHKYIINNYDNLVNSFKTEKTDKIIVNELNSRKVIVLSEIIGIEASGSYSIFHFQDHSNIIVSKRLKHFEEILSDFDYFFRCHKSWIVATNKIQSLNPTQYFVTMSNGKEINFSRNQKEKLMAIIEY